MSDEWKTVPSLLTRLENTFRYVVENPDTGELKVVEVQREEDVWENIAAGKWVDPYIVQVDAKDEVVGPVERPTAHNKGVPHRAVHLEIVRDDSEFLTWVRKNGRLEIPGGHVDWLEHLGREETYEEAALREAYEELNLSHNSRIRINVAAQRMKPFLRTSRRIINQLPSSAGNNNEWVRVHRLDWQSSWGEPTTFAFGSEGHTEARWLTLEALVATSERSSMRVNSALTLLLQRHERLVPILGRV